MNQQGEWQAQEPELRAIANKIGGMYFSTQAAAMDAADIVYEALELVWRERNAQIAKLQALLTTEQEEVRFVGYVSEAEGIAGEL